MAPQTPEAIMQAHQKAVETISSKVKAFSDEKIPFRLYHGATNSTQARRVDPNRMIDTSKLNHVFKIDKERKTCLAEPNVAMDELVDALRPHDLLPPVVMEFPGITVGGGFAGTAGESSGFKEGFFDNTINWFEAVLPDGQVVKASDTEHPELFHAAAGSLGTLCVATLFEIRLIDWKPYVELTYHPTHDIKHSLDVLAQSTTNKSHDYIDGITFSPNRGVVITGHLTDTPTTRTQQRFSRAHDPWFYLHASKTTKRHASPYTFHTPTRDYLFRYDRGAFWTGKYAFAYFSPYLPLFNRISRFLLDSYLHTRVMYHALHVSGHMNKYIVQDLLLPRSTAEAFVKWVEKEFGFQPLWLCPFIPQSTWPVALHPRLDYEGEKEGVGNGMQFVNIGVWGPGPTKWEEFVEMNRKLEAKVRELGGIKWLYAQAYYTEEEFWGVYDREWYEGMRKEVGAEYLPSVFEKVRAKEPVKGGGDQRKGVRGAVKRALWDLWPFSGLYGVYKARKQRDYLLGKA